MPGDDERTAGLTPAVHRCVRKSCSPAWSHVQNQTPRRSRVLSLLGHHAARQRGAMFKTRRLAAHASCPSSATTLLASVEPCSKPDASPLTRLVLLRPPRCSPARSHVQNQTPRRSRVLSLFGHHAARQRGAMFKTRRLAAHASCPSSATTLLASVEPCSKPDAAPLTRLVPLRPPRCSPAWSHVQNQTPRRPASCPSSATTLLASVEPCSKPDASPPRVLSFFGHHAARQRGAMFKTRRSPPQCVQHVEHRSTLASSVVAKPPISWSALVLNTAARWRAAWWRSRRSRGRPWS